MRTLSYLPLLAMVALLAAPACKFNCSMGGGGDLGKKTEKAILDANADVLAKVTCPSDVSADAGTKFDCQVELKNGTQATYSVSVNDDAGNISFEPKK